MVIINLNLKQSLIEKLKINLEQKVIKNSNELDENLLRCTNNCIEFIPKYIKNTISDVDAKILISKITFIYNISYSISLEKSTDINSMYIIQHNADVARLIEEFLIYIMDNDKSEDIKSCAKVNLNIIREVEKSLIKL